MTDKPLYQPGETIWFRVDLRSTATLAPGATTGSIVRLVSPRGAVVAKKRVAVEDGVARNDFELPAAIDGGEYALELHSDDATRDARKIVVNTYEPPRLKKSVEFVREAYGEGDKVSAAIDVRRATGEPFAEVQRISVKTDTEDRAAPVRVTIDP